MKKIAIVDDDSIFQFTTKVKIEKLQLASSIEIFNDGDEIYKHLQEVGKEDWPDIVLLDINMPIVDGWDFLELYRDLSPELHKHISIFMLSSSINPVDVDKANENEFVKEYVTKPIKDEVLSSILS